MTSQQKATEAALEAAYKATRNARSCEEWRALRDGMLIPAMKANAAAWGNPW